jgi:hypothetical protein
MNLVLIFTSAILLTTNLNAQYLSTLNTAKSEDSYSDLEINTLYQINFQRILQKLKPLYTNKSLNHYSKSIASKLQTKNIDTTISNVVLVYYNDSIPLTHPLLKDTFDLIGIHTLPHQYNCHLMVITLDKRRQQIKWKDLDCPKFTKNR